MPPKNIVLIGFMGAGKSMVSNRLASILKLGRVSTDELIEKKEKRAIPEIFRDSGEAYFRQLEETVVREVSALEGWVIDCGGGVVVNPKNLENLRKNGVLFYLKTSPEIVYKRIKNQTHRPLLQVQYPLEKIRELLRSREAFYAQADHVIDTDAHSVEDSAQAVLKILRHE